MSRINVDDDWFQDPRRSKLEHVVGREVDTVALEMWRLAQRYVRRGENIPIDVWELMPRWREFEEAGLARRENGNVYVCGTKAYFEWLISRREAGRLGGIASGDSRQRSKMKHMVEATKQNEPSSSSSSSSSKTHTPKPPRGLPEGFLSVWNTYPKKVGKLAALQIWNRLKINGKLPVILDAIEKQKQSVDWTKEGGRYVPSLARWLREGRWEDELPLSGGPEIVAEDVL